MLCVLASVDDSIILEQRKTYFDRYIFKAFQVAMLTIYHIQSAYFRPPFRKPD
jgi:hypothetical protein